MVDVVAAQNEVLNLLVLLSVLGIIGIFLTKFYNVLHSGKKFSIQTSTIFLAVGIICYLFIEVGLFVSVPSDVDVILLEFNFYIWFSRIFLVMIVIFWFTELILNVVNSVSEEDELTRMSKRRFERFNNY